MIGAIIGDIVGSRFEFLNPPNKSIEFELFTKDCKFTDDTVLTVATADAILTWKETNDDMYKIAGGKYIAFTKFYPRADYGPRYIKWAFSNGQINNNSFGNGSAMRISPMAYISDDLDICLEMCDLATKTSHDHEEGLKGARSVVSSIFLLRHGYSKEEVESYVDKNYYSMDIDLDKIRPEYKFDCTCQKSVPEALKCFFDSNDFESAIRLAVSLGGDTDTQAAIAGSLAGAYYDIPIDISLKAREYLSPHMNEIMDKFENEFIMEV